MENTNSYVQPISELYSVGRANSATLTKVHFTELLYERLGLTRTEASSIVDAIFDEIEQALVDGRDVKLANFGTFVPRDKVARPGRNPRTGAPHTVSARRVVSFVPAQHMRDSVAEFTDPEFVAKLENNNDRA